MAIAASLKELKELAVSAADIGDSNLFVPKLRQLPPKPEHSHGHQQQHYQRQFADRIREYMRMNQIFWGYMQNATCRATDEIHARIADERAAIKTAMCGATTKGLVSYSHIVSFD
jgi:hypothetical protein